MELLSYGIWGELATTGNGRLSLLSSRISTCRNPSFALLEYLLNNIAVIPRPEYVVVCAFWRRVTNGHELPRGRADYFGLRFEQIGGVGGEGVFGFYFLLHCLLHIGGANVADFYFLWSSNNTDRLFFATDLHAVVETHYRLFEDIQERLIPHVVCF